MDLNHRVLMLIFLLITNSALCADLETVSKGRAPGPEMSMKSSKVPQYSLVQKTSLRGKTDFKKISSIPRLNIGEEEQLKAGQLIPLQIPPDLGFQQPVVKPGKSIKKIQFEKALSLPIKPIKPAISMVAGNQKSQPPPLPIQSEVAEPTSKDPNPQPKKLEDLTQPQMDLLYGLIYLEQRKDPMTAIGLFADLQNSPIKTDASYQLALAAKQLKIHSEFRWRMLQLLSDKNKDWQSRAAQALALNATEGDKSLVPLLDPKLEELKIELEKADQYQINRAKFYLERASRHKDDLTKALQALDEVPTDSPLSIESQFLRSLVYYRSGQFEEAEKLQEAVLKSLESERPDSELRSISALTLARLRFQMGQYKKAFEAYLKVDKSNPEWLQAMIEQAWTQILSKDYEGAAGNMFSLHTDFFKKAFQPESYIVRTVGYLNLCQYGDGAKVLHDFKRKYAPVIKKMSEYKAKAKDSIHYYDTIKNWSKNPDLKTMDGLPREFLFSLLRHPSFIQEQKNINSLEDQMEQVNKVSLELVQGERKLIAQQSEAQSQLSNLRDRLAKAPDEAQKNYLKDQISETETKMSSLKLQMPVGNKARLAMKNLRPQLLSRLDQEKVKARDLAGQAIQIRFSKQHAKLTESIDQSEILQYELFSGAGEHLRYQLAGGDVNKKERPELKAEDGKAINWEFKGEIWEDEIGHFRSGLENVCAPEDKN